MANCVLKRPSCSDSTTETQLHNICKTANHAA